MNLHSVFRPSERWLLWCTSHPAPCGHEWDRQTLWARGVMWLCKWWVVRLVWFEVDESKVGWLEILSGLKMFKTVHRRLLHLVKVLSSVDSCSIRSTSQRASTSCVSHHVVVIYRHKRNGDDAFTSGTLQEWGLSRGVTPNLLSFFNLKLISSNSLQ